MSTEIAGLEIQPTEKSSKQVELSENQKSERSWLEAIGQTLLPVCCVAGGALIGPLAAILPPGELKGQRSMLQVCWRFGPLLVMMIAAMPFYLMFKRPRFDFDWTTFGALVFTQLMNFALSYAFVFLAFYTVLSHVGMITHLGGCFLLMHTMMTCAKTHHLEKAGLLLALVGFIVMVLDPNAIKDGEKVNVWIDLLALLVNFLWIGFFLGSEYVKTRMEIDTIAILGTPMMFIIGMVLSLTIEGTSFDASNDGIFGFLRPENAHVCFVWNAIFSAGFAMYGYMYALNFYSTVFVMNFLLIEPIGAQIFGVMLGIDVWPGWMTWVGAGMCVVSINVIHQGEIRRD